MSLHAHVMQSCGTTCYSGDANLEGHGGRELDMGYWAERAKRVWFPPHTRDKQPRCVYEGNISYASPGLIYRRWRGRFNSSLHPAHCPPTYCFKGRDKGQGKTLIHVYCVLVILIQMEMVETLIHLLPTVHSCSAAVQCRSVLSCWWSSPGLLRLVPETDPPSTSTLSLLRSHGQCCVKYMLYSSLA